MIISENLKELKFLKPGIQNFNQEKNWIIQHVFHNKEIQSIQQQELLTRMITLRSIHFPLQYLLETTEFYKISFMTTFGVLIPREETECLVEYAIKSTPFQANVLEIGVGSGIISIAIQKNRPDLTIEGIDISPQAIECSKKNAKILLPNKTKINFYESDLFYKVDKNKKFDLIISNPPYLSEDESHFSDEELFFEPTNALITDRQGLLIYERIAMQAKSFLRKKGLLILEISPYRIDAIKELFTNNGYNFQNILIDYLGIERALVFIKDK